MPPLFCILNSDCCITTTLDQGVPRLALLNWRHRVDKSITRNDETCAWVVVWRQLWSAPLVGSWMVSTSGLRFWSGEKALQVGTQDFA
jgi:hypothetical protein